MTNLGTLFLTGHLSEVGQGEQSEWGAGSRGNARPIGFLGVCRRQLLARPIERRHHLPIGGAVQIVAAASFKPCAVQCISPA